MPSRLAALIALLLASPLAAAEEVGTYVWQADGIGGLSGIEVSDGGRSFVAISDRAGIVSGQFQRDAAGRIRGVSASPLRRLRDRQGGPLPQSPAGDSEGLALAPDGSLYISFEGRHRVWHYARPDAVPEALPRPDAFDTLAENAGLEGLAIDGDGRLYTLPEEATRRFPVHVYDGDRWSQPFSLPVRDGFRAVGLDFDDRGRLYLLERSFAFIGFASRVRRFTLDGDSVTGEETLLTTDLRRHDNLEGISVWRDAGGRLRMTLVADDNFIPLQRTEIVEYRVPD